MICCTFPNCFGTHRARGYCGGHYQQLITGVQLRPLRKRSETTPHNCTCEPSARCYGHHGCRCDACRRAHTRQHKAWRLRSATSGPSLIDSTGTLRRLRALCRVGWSRSEIADMLGVTTGNLQALISGRDFVYTRTAKAVMRVYDRRWQGPPKPTTPREVAKRTRAIRAAERHGWDGPLAWDDGDGPHGIDNPAATPATASDQACPVADEVEHLIDSDSVSGICKRLGYHDRQVLYSKLRKVGRGDLAERLITMQAAESEAMRESRMGVIQGPGQRKRVA